MSAYNINAFGKKVQRGYIIREDTNEKIYFQINPTEIPDTHSAVYTSVDSPGSVYPEVNYIRQDIRKNVVTLNLDENVKMTINKDKKLFVEDMLKKLTSLTKPSKKSIVMVVGGTKRFIETPTCRFVFGKMVKKCKVTSVSIKRESFDAKLNCTKATVDIEILEVV